MKINCIYNDVLNLKRFKSEKQQKIIKSLNPAQRACLLTILSNPEVKESDFKASTLDALHIKLTKEPQSKG